LSSDDPRPPHPAFAALDPAARSQKLAALALARPPAAPVQAVPASIQQPGTATQLLQVSLWITAGQHRRISNDPRANGDVVLDIIEQLSGQLADIFAPRDGEHFTGPRRGLVRGPFSQLYIQLTREDRDTLNLLAARYVPMPSGRGNRSAFVRAVLAAAFTRSS
jgi:hypothetical protein